MLLLVPFWAPTWNHNRSQIRSEADFLEVCKKIDKTAEYTDSKKRKHTYSSVKNYLNSPVETEKTY